MQLFKFGIVSPFILFGFREIAYPCLTKNWMQAEPAARRQRRQRRQRLASPAGDAGPQVRDPVAAGDGGAAGLRSEVKS